MVNEVRKLDDPDAKDVEGGDVVLSLEQLKARAQGPGFMGPRDPFSSKMDESAKPPFFTETLLEDEFDKIWGKVARGDLDREAALEEAGNVLGQFIEKSEQLALTRLQQITGKIVSEESPEAQKLRTEEQKYYIGWFSKILDDILKKRE